MAHPHKCYDDHLTLMGLYSDSSRQAATVQLLKRLDSGGSLRRLVLESLTVPTLNKVKAHCWKGFEANAVPETMMAARREGMRRMPAVVRLEEITRGGYVTTTDHNRTANALRNIEHAKIDTVQKEEIKEVVLTVTEKAAKAEEDKQGWKEAALAWKAAFHNKNFAQNAIGTEVSNSEQEPKHH